MKFFRLISWLEALSAFVLFFIAMPIKYFTEMTNKFEIMWYSGMTHGVMFMIFFFSLLVFCHLKKWSVWTFLLGFICAIIPLGTLYFDWKVNRLETDEEE